MKIKRLFYLSNKHYSVHRASEKRSRCMRGRKNCGYKVKACLHRIDSRQAFMSLKMNMHDQSVH